MSEQAQEAKQKPKPGTRPEQKAKPRAKWIRKRHYVARRIAGALLAPVMKLKYGAEIEPFRETEKRAYLILFNHQTAFDQFFVGASFKTQLYYLASEDLFSNGLVSSLIRYLAAPIPIKKQTEDIPAVLKCLRVAKEGGTIALAPEGNRTYSGYTCSMKPSIVAMARRMKLPVLLYRIEGGYGVQPRWSDVTRRGRMKCGVASVIEPEEYAKLSDAEFYRRITEGLYVDKNCNTGRFRSGRRAEYLERALYVCPFCGLAELKSHKNRITCTKCGRSVEYGEDKALTGVGFWFPFRYIGTWYDYQNQFVSSLDPDAHTAEPLFVDTVRLSEVCFNRSKKLLRKKAEVRLYGDRVVIDEGRGDELTLKFDDLTAVTVLGRNKANLYSKEITYQLKGGKRFNALKYVNFYTHYHNFRRGETDGKLLGL